jgi:hypothetical protein
MSELGQSEKCRAVKRTSVNRLEADVLSSSWINLKPSLTTPGANADGGLGFLLVRGRLMSPTPG